MNRRILIVVTAFAASLLAQPPMALPGPGTMQPRTDAIKAYLSLTDSQIQSRQQLQTQERQALQTLLQQVRQKQDALQSLLQKGGADAATLGVLLLEIQNLRTTIASKESGLNGQAVNILTADQRTKLKTLQDLSQLLPAISEATGLHLLAPPQNANGDPIGRGPRFGMRPPFAQ